MRSKNIIEIFAKMASIPISEATAETTLIKMAQKEIYGRLKEGINPEEHLEKLEYAVAAEAFYRYAVIMEGKTISGKYQFGNVHIEQDTGDTLTAALSVRTLFLASVADILESDRNFLFRRVNEHVVKK